MLIYKIRGIPHIVNSHLRGRSNEERKAVNYPKKADSEAI